MLLVQRSAAKQQHLVRRFATWMASLVAVLAATSLAVGLLASRGHPPTAGTSPGIAYVLTYSSVVVSKVSAVRFSDGQLLWSSVESGFDTDPVSDQGIVYTVLYYEGGGVVLALRARDGSVLWQSGALSIHPQPILTAVKGVLYVQTGMSRQSPSAPESPSAIIAFRGRDGQVLWRYDTPDPIASPLVVSGSSLYVGVGSMLVALRASNGTPRWQVPLGAMNRPSLEWLVVDGTHLFAYVEEQSLDGSTLSRGPAHLLARRMSDGEPLWRFDLAPDLENVVSAPVVADGVVYVGAGTPDDSGSKPGSITLYALRADSGYELWDYQTPVDDGTAASPTLLAGPVFASGTLYFASGDLFMNAVHVSDHTIIWRHQLGLTRLATILAVTNQALYVSLSGSVLALRSSTGGTIWQQQTG